MTFLANLRADIFILHKNSSDEESALANRFPTADNVTRVEIREKMEKFRDLGSMMRLAQPSLLLDLYSAVKFDYNAEKERQLTSLKAAMFSSSATASTNGQIDKQNKIPDEFLCPITRELMKDPVINEHGQSYERKAVEEWLNSKTTDPKTNEKLKYPNFLVPNYALKEAISKHLQSQADQSINSSNFRK